MNERVNEDRCTEPHQRGDARVLEQDAHDLAPCLRGTFTAQRTSVCAEWDDGWLVATQKTWQGQHTILGDIPSRIYCLPVKMAQTEIAFRVRTEGNGMSLLTLLRCQETAKFRQLVGLGIGEILGDERVGGVVAGLLMKCHCTTCRSHAFHFLNHLGGAGIPIKTDVPAIGLRHDHRPADPAVRHAVERGPHLDPLLLPIFSGDTLHHILFEARNEFVGSAIEQRIVKAQRLAGSFSVRIADIAATKGGLAPVERFFIC